MSGIDKAPLRIAVLWKIRAMQDLFERTQQADTARDFLDAMLSLTKQYKEELVLIDMEPSSESEVK